MSRKIFTDGEKSSGPNNDGLLIGLGGYNSRMAQLFEDLPGLLASLRRKSGETLEEVGTKSGVGRRSVWGYESGETHPPVHKLAMVLAHFGIETFADLQRAHDEFLGVAPGPVEPMDSATVREQRLELALDLALENVANLKKILGEGKGH
jgi:transcriptional regulator with XRE-family HTH domain